MKPEFQSIRISLVDFMASFLPGTIWVLLFFTFINLPIFNPQSNVTDPISALISIVNSINMSETYSSLLFLAIFAIIVTVVGYTMNQISPSIAEPICFLDAIWKSKRNKIKREEYYFPYNAIFRPKPFFVGIVSSIREYIREDIESLPGKQPYSTCKRILKLISPELWQESEHAEADSRLTASLFSSVLFSIFVASLAIATAPSSSSSDVLWFGISLILLLILGRAFRERRLREVSYTYLNYLIAHGLTQNPSIGYSRKDLDKKKKK